MANDITDHLCAHRGYHNAENDNDPERPLENTLAAYQASFEHLRFAECDVQCTRDGTVVLAHDITLARVAELPSIPDSVELPWPKGALALFEPAATWYALAPAKRHTIEDKLPLAQKQAFLDLVSLVAHLPKASNIAPADLDAWIGSLDISRSAQELLAQLAPIERATLGIQEPAQPYKSILLQHYLAHRSVADLTLSQIEQIELKGGERVPLLTSVLEHLSQHPSGDRHLVIEVKPGSREVVTPLCKILGNLDLQHNATIMSFDLEVIQAVAKCIGTPSNRTNKAYRCLWLACTQDWGLDAHQFTYAQLTQAPETLEAVVKTITDSSLDGIYIEYDETIVTPAVFDKLKSLGLFVGVWSAKGFHDCVAVATELVTQGADLINTDEAVLLPKSLSQG